MDQAQFLVEYQIELILSLGTHNLGLHIEIVEWAVLWSIDNINSISSIWAYATELIKKSLMGNTVKSFGEIQGDRLAPNMLA